MLGFNEEKFAAALVAKIEPLLGPLVDKAVADLKDTLVGRTFTIEGLIEDRVIKITVL